ncbi:ASCH domain-containing protein [Candidatus Gracilibacteria bacterium]|nr:ASCH domain-containing protein [Candidatus Gracilibacteria bacterium]
MKTLKFATHLIPYLLSGEKTSTWRLFDDKNLSLGDELEFRNSENNQIVGYGKITSLEEKKICKMAQRDFDGHEKFDSIEEIIKNFRKYYGDGVDENSMVKVIHFSFKKA